MGSTVRNRSNIWKTEASTRWEEECVVYKTPDSRTCTIGAKVKVDSASITLKDYTFDREVTTLDITIGRGANGGVGIVNVGYDANVLNVSREQGQFAFVYGVSGVRVGAVSVTKVGELDKLGTVLLLTHSIEVAPRNISSFDVLVCYDFGKGRFMCAILMDTSCRSKLPEASRAMWKAHQSAIGVEDATTGHQTTMISLINNDGHVRCHLNGAIILNDCNIYLNNIK